MVVLLRSRIAWEGLKTNNNNPRRPREGQEQKKKCFGKFQLTQATHRASNIRSTAQRRRSPGCRVPHGLEKSAETFGGSMLLTLEVREEQE